MKRRRSLRGVLLRYAVVLFLNVISLLAFVAVIGLGIAFGSALVMIIGGAITLLFLVQCGYLVRIGKSGWDTRLARAKWRR
jgi:hypothetical protein